MCKGAGEFLSDTDIRKPLALGTDSNSFMQEEIQVKHKLFEIHRQVLTNPF